MFREINFLVYEFYDSNSINLKNIILNMKLNLVGSFACKKMTGWLKAMLYVVLGLQ